MKYLWVWKKTLDSIKKTGEYDQGKSYIPNDHLFYGTEEDLGQLVADTKQWSKLEECKIFSRKKIDRGVKQ